MGESIRRASQPLGQVAEQIGPRLRARRETRRQGGDVEQDRFHPFHHRQSGESGRVGARGTQQLCGGAYKRRVVWMPAKTQSHSEFFMAQARVVWREICWKIPLVVAGPPVNGAFEQPFADSLFRTTAPLAEVAQQG